MLGIASPIILGVMARIMLAPPGPMIRRFRIPPHVVSEVYLRNPAAKEEIRDSVGKTRDLCAEIGLVNALTRRIWQAMGIWAAPRAPARG
jgi:hypothetical protein